MPTVLSGDILAYRDVHTLGEALIDVGELLQDGTQRDTYYHVAIALSPVQQIAAIAGKGVVVLPITTDDYSVFRPPIPLHNRVSALQAVKELEGERYDKWLIADDALRMLTAGHLHLPDSFLRSLERHEKICSSLVTYYFNKADFTPPLRLTYKSTPQDVTLSVRKWRVLGG